MNEKLIAKNMNLLKLQRYQQHDEGALVRLGTPNWESIKYRGTLYDFDTPINEFLKNYAAQYDAVEYRESFVDVPSERRMLALKSEVENVNKNFKFCPTIPRRISHEFELGENIFDLKEFLESIEVLGEHLGPCVLRLPETFATSSMKRIFKFLKLWPAEKRLAIHFTHLEAYKGNHLHMLVKELMGSSISLLIEDRIEAPIVSERLLNSDHLILRFYGRPSLNQDDQRLAMWVYKLGEYKAYGIKNPYLFLHEQEEMCLAILKRMATSMGGNIRVPQSFDVNSKQMGFSF
jgi:uncharacterized protein YecE (DUF72 family)